MTYELTSSLGVKTSKTLKFELIVNWPEDTPYYYIDSNLPPYFRTTQNTVFEVYFEAIPSSNSYALKYEYCNEQYLKEIIY